MLLLDRQSGATAQPRTEANYTGVLAGRVQLRLRADGQVFELPAGKTTIGSSPRCNVRIERPGVQPLHCLIVDGPNGLRVRSWVANTALNGVPFDESALAIGDCLSLGPVELEVIDPLAVVPQPKAVEAPVVEPKDAELVREGRDRARARSRRLLDTLRHERTSHHELCQQVLKLQESHLDAIAEQNGMGGKLAKCLAELAEARQQLVEFQSVEVARQQLAERNEQLGFEIGELSAQINELTHGHAESAKNRQQLADDHAALKLQHRQLIEAHDKLQGEVGQAAGEKAATYEQNQQLVERNERLGFEIGELSAQINELTHRHAESAESRQQLADDHAALELRHRELIEAHDKVQGEVGLVDSEKLATHEQYQELMEQNSQLQSEFDRIANENKSLRDESQHFGETNSRLQSDARQLAKEKAAADEHNRALVQQQLQLHNEVSHLSEQKAQLEDEREALRGQNEHLLSEARELTGERGSLAEERASLCQERSELRQQNEALRARVAQLNEENSAMAVGKLSLVEECDMLGRKTEQLQARLAHVNEEHATLAAAKATLADDQARLMAEQKRLTELDREMGAAAAGHENTSAELYRALLQITEMQERDVENKAVVEAYESLSKEHDRVHEELDQLKQQIESLSTERVAVEGAWQELSAEAEALSESQQRLADENAKLVAHLEEARQQLEQAQQEKSTLAGSAAELELERAAKVQAEAEIAAAVADGERRLVEQERRLAEQARNFAEQSSLFHERSRQHAEAIQLLGQQLAAANDSHGSLTRAREAAQAQLANADLHRGEQSRRIQELETQLAVAEARAAKAVELAASRLEANQKSVVVEPILSGPEHADSASHVAGEEPAEFRWPSARSESAVHDEPNVSGGEDLNSRKSLDESLTVKAAWHAAGSDVTADDAVAEPAVYAWSNASESKTAADEPNPWVAKAELVEPVDASTFGEDDDSSPAGHIAEVAESAHRPAAWAEVPAESGLLFTDPDFAKPEELAQEESSPESKPVAKHEPPSFIERYSHLLAEDGAASEEAPVRPNELAPVRPIVPVVARLEEAVLAPAKSEDEDSIEQYMAKLLQRVRGESDGGKAAREAPSRMPLNVPAAKPVERPAAVPSESRAEGLAVAIDTPSTGSIEPIKRRVSSPAPATNLGALRALANETARMAISRHELRKLRRNAVTKTIVATLAGMTSLWLMLDSPAWTHIQFITACGALLVAVYWASEAFRTLLNSMRLAAYEGPEETALPIDVEEKL